MAGPEDLGRGARGMEKKRKGGLEVRRERYTGFPPDTNAHKASQTTGPSRVKESPFGLKRGLL